MESGSLPLWTRSDSLEWCPLFNWSRRHRLEDGRELVVVLWDEERWAVYLPGDPKRPSCGRTPADAINEHLGIIPGREPRWVTELSRDFEEELRTAPRFICDCCGFRTLLSKGRYEICAVCFWEDDPSVGPDNADEESGPNHMTLTLGRENYASIGASSAPMKEHTRPPRPEERG